MPCNRLSRPFVPGLCGLVLLVTLALVACGPTPQPVAARATAAPTAQATATTAATNTPPPTPTPVPPTETATATHTAVPTPTETATTTPSHTPTVAPSATSVPPTLTATSRPLTATRVPASPTPKPVPSTPTPVDWTKADWPAMAQAVLKSARTYLPLAQELKIMLAQPEVRCPRLAQLIDALSNAPHFKDMDQNLWARKGKQGLEGRLWTVRDAYEDAVNTFRLDTYQRMKTSCVAGQQPTAEWKQEALRYMESTTDVVGKLQEVARELEAAGISAN